MPHRHDNSRRIRAPRGRELTARSWQAEAPLRMLMNNLDPEVAERPAELVVYGGIGRAARNWECFDQIVASLRALNADETLLVQSAQPAAGAQAAGRIALEAHPVHRIASDEEGVLNVAAEAPLEVSQHAPGQELDTWHRVRARPVLALEVGV